MSALALNAELLIGSPVGWPAGLPALPRRWFEPLRASRPAAEATRSNDAPAHAADVVDPNDWRDVRASLAGDGEAYGRLVRRYQDQIAAHMWRFTRDQGAWEELVHDVFVESYLSLRSFRGRAPLLHWLRKIATRVGYRWWKKQSRQKAETPLSLDQWKATPTAAPDESSAREAGEVVHALLERLSARDRLVLTLFYLEGCSVAEISQSTGWSQTMVKVQTHRARKRLKRLCEQLEIEP